MSESEYNYTLKYKKKFKDDLEKINRQGKSKNRDINDLNEIIGLLAQGIKLPEINKDHKLKGSSKGNKECHIKGDWLLEYRIKNDELILIRTGSHSELGL